jgi:hypothetical protein
MMNWRGVSTIACSISIFDQSIVHAEVAQRVDVVRRDHHAGRPRLAFFLAEVRDCRCRSR